MRMAASWSGSNDPTVYKSVARSAPQWQAPLGSSIDRPGTPQTPKLCIERPPVAVYRRSACSGVKALRNTSDARRQAAKLCYRFGPLTPSARSANLIAGDGTKNGPSPLRTKNYQHNPKQPLDTRSPIQVHCELGLGLVIWRFMRNATAASRSAIAAASSASERGCTHR